MEDLLVYDMTIPCSSLPLFHLSALLSLGQFFDVWLGKLEVMVQDLCSSDIGFLDMIQLLGVELTMRPLQNRSVLPLMLFLAEGVIFWLFACLRGV